MVFSFTHAIQRWYSTHKRLLPWRSTNDAYTIWLSEIILQQTKVSQGLPYFEKFLNKFPTVTDFANSTEDEILNLWQGLGYYSRGRNMLKCAREVVENHQGSFPKTYAEMIKLPGIGDYTASAILSFAYNVPHAVLDGNVYRVLSRFYNIDDPIQQSSSQKLFKSLAEEVLDKTNPANHNQAIMEFGALHCTPKSPDCGSCVLSEQCQAFQAGTVPSRPVKLKSKPSKKRYFNYFVFYNSKGKSWIQKRSKGDIWQGLHEFPLFESEKALEKEDVDKYLNQHFNMPHAITTKRFTTKHILSHQTIFTNFWLVPTPTFVINGNSDIFEVNLQELGDVYAMPTLMHKFLQTHLMEEICQ